MSEPSYVVACKYCKHNAFRVAVLRDDATVLYECGNCKGDFTLPKDQTDSWFNQPVHPDFTIGPVFVAE